MLARLADGLWPDDAPHAEDRQGLCELLANEIANRDAEDGEPALLLGLVGPDACADWPEERERSVLGELGPSVRVLISVSGPREAAERWAERLALDVSTIAWVPVSGFRLALGLDASVEIAERGGSSGQARIAALAALCCAAPAPSRPALAARAVAAYRESGDTDGLETVIRCAAWMSPHDAAWLFARSLGDAAGSVTLASTLSGWGGVKMLAPLVARIGGDSALAAVADALHGADAWLAWMESGDRNN
ncbi:hypothetical protein WME98_41330 [Sorangium sp. So ce296]|uniref:hypothetical protein n=1 Tax=Sorangium sp. So ce296 TaxID=3133296 RepID=UPI003F60B245